LPFGAFPSFSRLQSEASIEIPATETEEEPGLLIKSLGHCVSRNELASLYLR
jgi:hypothetical protein